MKLNERLKHAWNAFTVDNNAVSPSYTYGRGSGSGATHKIMRRVSANDFASAIYNRIAMDVAMTRIHHVKVDLETEDRTDMHSTLHDILNVEANIDQTGIQFMQDLVYSMFDEGVVAIVPVDTTISPNITGGYDILSVRVGKIVQWYPKDITVRVYNERTGLSQEITVPKAMVAIIENPLFAVINGPNATLARLLRKMSQLDEMDEMTASGKLDLIIQTPAQVKTDLQQRNALERIDKLETQLNHSRHGIAYMDGTEKITQLNRPINDSLPDDIEKLTQQFYNQLGLTATIFNGTAKESEMRGYYNRTIDPIIDGIIAEMSRKFLTKTARTQGQILEAYRDPFTLVPVEQIAEIGDKLKRNAILTTNEIRSIIGYKRSNAPQADELYNPNMPTEQQPTGSLTSPAEEAINAQLNGEDNKEQEG